MNLKDLRRNCNKTQKELADEIGVDVSVISKYESGTVSPPPKRIAALASALNVEPEVLTDIDNEIAVEKANKQIVSLLRRMIIYESGGKCELCGKDAPFKGKDGLPYLKPYQLSTYLGDHPEKKVVVICPNCLAKMRVIEDPLDYEKLLEKAEEHNF